MKSKQIDNKNVYDVIVIGAGPAGLTASIYAARKGLQTLVVSRNIGGQAAIPGNIQNFPGFSLISGPELVSKFRTHIESLDENLKVLEDREVVALSKEGEVFFVTDREGEIFNSRSVIIATGRDPQMLNVPGEHEYLGRGVAVCAICDAPLYRNKEVVVVGGGNAAMGSMLSLAAVAKKIYSVNYNSFLAGDENLKKRVQKIKKVEFLSNVKVLKILGDKFVTGVVVQDRKNKAQKTLSVSGVFIEIGWEPSVDFDSITEKDKFKRIIVDGNLSTSVPGLFAAGDVNDAWGEQIIIAAGEGAKAALAAFDYLAKK